MSDRLPITFAAGDIVRDKPTGATFRLGGFTHWIGADDGWCPGYRVAEVLDNPRGCWISEVAPQINLERVAASQIGMLF